MADTNAQAEATGHCLRDYFLVDYKLAGGKNQGICRKRPRFCMENRGRLEHIVFAEKERRCQFVRYLCSMVAISERVATLLGERSFSVVLVLVM